MANLTITLPDALVPRILAAFGAEATPATVKAALIDYIRTTVRNHEGDTARAEASAAADSGIVLT